MKMIHYDEFIQYGRVEHSEQFRKLHATAIQVAYIASILSKTFFNQTLTTTSIFRKKSNDSGIHSAYRAIDFKLLPNIEETYLLVEMINKIYTYDSRPFDHPSLFPKDKLEKRKALKVAHDNPFHGTGGHIHIQVSDFTTFLTNDHKKSLILQATADLKNFQATPLGVA